MVPIPKIGKSSRRPSDFRPISLLSCVGKTMERMVNRRLITLLEEEGRLDDRQYAFRKGRGAGVYLGCLGEILDEARSNGHHVDIAALDIAKAYNTVWRDRTLRQLRQWGVVGNLEKFVNNFLTDRKFRVAVGGVLSDEFKEENGVPQGSVLSVTLFLVAMNSVFDKLPIGIYIFVYADDIVIVATGPTIARVRIKLQAAVNQIAQWAASVGFKIAAEKCVISHCCQMNHNPSKRPVYLNGEKIPFRKGIKLIGITLDRRTNFKKHFKCVKEECCSRRRLVKTISSRHRNNNRNTIIRVANSVLVSKLCYGIELTCRGLSEMIATLSPVYNTAIRNASGLLPSTPTTSACVEAGVISFDLVLKRNVLNRAIGFLEKTTGDEDGLQSIANDIATEILDSPIPEIARVQRVYDRKWYCRGVQLDWKLKKQLRAGDSASKVIPIFNHHRNKHYAGYRMVYTDGSKSDNGVGGGVLLPDLGKYFKLPEHCSVFSAEAAAILSAVSDAKSFDIPTVIFSDSASVLMAIEGGHSKHPWIQAIEKAAPHNLTMCWVPGHCGIPGNNEADHLAGLGRTGRYLTEETPGQDIRHLIKKRTATKFAECWRLDRSTFLRKIKGETSQWIDRSNRREQIVLSRLRTGHTRFSHFLTSGKYGKPSCETCGEHNSVEHVLINCPMYQNLREYYGLPPSILEVLGNDDASEITLIMFLKEAQLYNKI